MNEKIMFISDLHCPEHDEVAVSAVLKFMKSQKPDLVILGGDIIDFFQVSRFPKLEQDRVAQLQNDIDVTVSVLKQIRKAAGKARIIYLSGNHEERMEKYLATQAKELAGLRSLKVERLLELKEMCMEYKKEYIHKKLLFYKHGDICRTDSATTARAEMVRMGMSGVSGHIHSSAMFYKTNVSGTYVWTCSGCLCPTNGLGYCKNPSWQQSIVLTTFGKKYFHSEIVPIIHGSLVYGGREYKGGKE